MSLPTPLASPDLVPALASSWFGGGLPPEAVARLAAIATLREVPAGTELFHEGQLTEAMSIVMAGRVALRTLVPERGMVTILTVETGDIVGWSAVVPPHRATSAGIAIEAVTLLELPGRTAATAPPRGPPARCIRLPPRAPGRRPPPVGHPPPAARPVRARGVGTARGPAVVIDEYLPYAPYPSPTGTAVAAPPAPIGCPGTAAVRGSSPGPTSGSSWTSSARTAAPSSGPRSSTAPWSTPRSSRRTTCRPASVTSSRRVTTAWSSTEIAGSSTTPWAR